MTQSTPQQGPTVVLVHGAFADAGSWAPVTERRPAIVGTTTIAAALGA